MPTTIPLHAFTECIISKSCTSQSHFPNSSTELMQQQSHFTISSSIPFVHSFSIRISLFASSCLYFSFSFLLPRWNHHRIYTLLYKQWYKITIPFLRKTLLDLKLQLCIIFFSLVKSNFGWKLHFNCAMCCFLPCANVWVCLCLDCTV